MSFVINFLFVIHVILGSHVELLVTAHQCFKVLCLGWVEVKVSVLSTNTKSEFLWRDLSVGQALIANKYPQ